jgi:hypothetical protein
VSEIPLPNDSLDLPIPFELHQVPDTSGAIKHIAAKLKPGAPFLIYLCYALHNRPIWFRAVWRMTNVAGLIIPRFPEPIEASGKRLDCSNYIGRLRNFAAC